MTSFDSKSPPLTDVVSGVTSILKKIDELKFNPLLGFMSTVGALGTIGFNVITDAPVDNREELRKQLVKYIDSLANYYRSLDIK